MIPHIFRWISRWRCTLRFMAYQIQPGFIVCGKTYPATIEARDVDNVESLLASGRVAVVADRKPSNAEKAGDK